MEPMDELVGILSREHLLLQRLLFKLTVLRQMLLAGEARFLVWASDEVTAATEVVRDAELRRALVFNQVAEAHELDPAVFDWDALIGAATEPFRTLLIQLRGDLSALQQETKAQVAQVRELSTAGSAGVQDLIDRITGVGPADLVAATGGYGPAGVAPARIRRSL